MYANSLKLFIKFNNWKRKGNFNKLYIVTKARWVLLTPNTQTQVV